MGLEDRIIIANSELKRRIMRGKLKGDEAQKLLSTQIYKDALLRALGHKETLYLIRVCTGLASRRHYSKETTIRLISSAIEFLTTKDGARIKKDRQGEYAKIIGELNAFKELISRLDKKDLSSMKEYKEKTNLALERVITVLDFILEGEPGMDETSEIQSLESAVLTFKLLLQKPK